MNIQNYQHSDKMDDREDDNDSEAKADEQEADGVKLP